MIKLSIERKVQVAFAFALVCLSVVGTMSFVSIVRLQGDISRVLRSEHVIESLRTILSRINEAESAQRGHTITGDESFLTTYKSLKEKLDAELQTLRQLTAGQAGLQRQMDALIPLVERRMAISRQVAELRRREGFPAALAATASGMAKVFHEKVIKLMDEMEASDRAWLKELEDRVQNDTFIVKAAIIGGSSLAFAFVIGSLVVIRRDFAGSRKAEAALLVAHGELETRVRERTAELAAAEGKFRTLVEQSIVGIYIIRDEMYVYVNPKMAEIFGTTPERMTQRPIYDFIAPEDHALARENCRKRISGDVPSIHYSLHMVHQSGTVLQVEVHGARAEYDGGAAVIGTLLDVTERNQAEEALRVKQKHSEALLQLARQLERALTYAEIFRAAREEVAAVIGFNVVWLYLLSEDGRHFKLVTSDDGAAERNWTADGDVLLIEGDPMLEEIATAQDLVFVEDARTDPRTNKSIVEKLGNRTIANMPIVLSGKHLGCIGAGTYGDEGIRKLSSAEKDFFVALASHLAVVLDRVTAFAERSQAEESLSRKTAWLQAQVDSSLDGILVVDQEGRKVLQNQRMVDLWQFPPEVAADADDTRQLEYAVSQTRDPDAFLAKVRHLYAHADEISHDEVELKTGTVLDRYSSPVRGKDSQHYGRIWTFRDITEKKHLAAQALRQQRMESIGALAGGIAHDLNNALAPILMASEILKLTSSDPEMDRILDTINESAKRGAAMVKQILTFARGSEGERGIVQPKQLIKEMVGIIQQTFPKTIQVRTDIANDTGTVLGNPTQLHQILLNLCVNARDAMAKGGVLKLVAGSIHLNAASASLLSGAKPGRFVVLAVMDTGTGMPPEVRARIFDPFFTTKTPDKGTGLGLSTVQKIVKDHSGFVTVDSKVGEGTTFKIYLPAAEEAALPALEAVQTAPPMGHGELILVVDDEAAIRSIATQTLQAFGYRVLTAEDGAQAVAICAQQMGDLQMIISDMAMPIMDGQTAIRAIRTLAPRLKVVAASGSDSLAGSSVLKELDVQGFLQKPYRAEDLLRIVHATLHGENATPPQDKGTS